MSDTVSQNEIEKAKLRETIRIGVQEGIQAAVSKNKKAIAMFVTYAAGFVGFLAASMLYIMYHIK